MASISFYFLQWSFNTYVISGMTLAIILISLLFRRGVFQVCAHTAGGSRLYIPGKQVSLKTWMQGAVVVSFLLPTVLLILWWHTSLIRTLLLLYMAVHIAQILTEMLVVKLFRLPQMDVFVGILYTTYRVCQLAVYQQLLGFALWKDFSVKAVLWTGMIFWSFNLIFLLISLYKRLP